jgi:UPF0716 protein FxsA
MIFSILLVLFIALPLIELVLLLEVGSMLGPLPTIGLVVLTGVIGATLARWQGLSLLLQLRRDLNEGRMPAPLLLDGVMIIVAGALLVTPGLLTDTFGFLLLVPPFRRILKAYVRARIERRFTGREVIDVSYTEW